MCAPVPGAAGKERIMRRSVAVLAVTGCVGAGAVGGAALAGGGSTNDGPGAVSTQAIGGAQAPNARLAVVVRSSGAVLRSKGVRSVSNPAPGIYCIRPSRGAGIRFGKYVPSVSVEWGGSLGDALSAQWHASTRHCASKRIEVHTYNGDDGSWDPDGDVAFTVVVP
jgi:hypothetical protein